LTLVITANGLHDEMVSLGDGRGKQEKSRSHRIIEFRGEISAEHQSLKVRQIKMSSTTSDFFL